MMEEFREIVINGRAYEDIGYFTLYKKAIIIETTNELISIFRAIKNEGASINEVKFINNRKTLATYEGSFIVDSINNNNEVQLYPI